MSTGRQVDYLIWAVAEARRLRTEAEKVRLADADVVPLEPYRHGDGFVTEWQSPEEVGRPI